MSDLNERFDQAFHSIEPGAAPVEAAMEHGRKIRIRRRAAVLAGSAAVIAAAVVASPVLGHHQALPGPSTSHVRVTVNPPGPHSPAGTIASGLIGTRPWNIRLESPGTKNCVITGTGLGDFLCRVGLPRAGADPVAFAGMGGSDNAGNGGQDTFFVSYGVLREDVTSVRVVLANGTVLTPVPVTLNGGRWVAFANPVGVPVTSITAYSRTGEIATATPFAGPSGNGIPSFASWLRPGQAGAARVTQTVASGTANGKAWQVTVYTGPWGICIAGGDGESCSAPTPMGSGGAAEIGVMGMTPSGALVYGRAADPVSYLIVTPENGTAIRVTATVVGQEKYFGFALSRWPRKTDRWTAYNAAGTPVASGSLS